MRKVTLVLVLLLAAGCNPFAPKCHDDTVTVEEVPSDPFYGILDVEWYEDLGYTCTYDGAVRNAFGGQIGSRYTCTKCVK